MGPTGGGSGALALGRGDDLVSLEVVEGHHEDGREGDEDDGRHGVGTVVRLLHAAVQALHHTHTQTQTHPRQRGRAGRARPSSGKPRAVKCILPVSPPCPTLFLIYGCG